jgi:hypothetical protein
MSYVRMYSVFLSAYHQTFQHTKGVLFARIRLNIYTFFSSEKLCR